jgi:hypothetical protein
MTEVRSVNLALDFMSITNELLALLVLVQRRVLTRLHVLCEMLFVWRQTVCVFAVLT